MKRLNVVKGIGLVLATLTVLAGNVSADDLVNPYSKVKRGERHENGREAQYVMLTGSLIPQRVEVKSIGTKTTSNLRVIGRREPADMALAIASTIACLRTARPAFDLVINGRSAISPTRRELTGRRLKVCARNPT